MSAPFEIMAVPFDVYLAPAGTAKPDIDAAIDASGSDWVLLGRRGADEYDAGGITVTHGQTVNVYRGLRGTAGVKAFRTEEELTFGFTLNDLTLESYGKVLNDAMVDDAGNSRAISIYQGAQVATFALVARSPDGPYGDGLPVQYWIPNCFQSGSPAVVHQKGIPAGLALVFTAMLNLEADSDDERFGVLEAQDVAGS